MNLAGWNKPRHKSKLPTGWWQWNPGIKFTLPIHAPNDTISWFFFPLKE